MYYIDKLTADKNNPFNGINHLLGLAGIFRKIACIGDSLSSGEFEVPSESNPGRMEYIDMFEYSWGQFLGRHVGSTVYNFSRGGMTAREYVKSFADKMDFWNPEKASHAYIIALGANDRNQPSDSVHPLGSVSDICPGHPENNRDTFAGLYATIIDRYRIISPNAYFFLVTMPHEEQKYDDISGIHASLIHEIASLYNRTYVIDFYKYAPRYDSEFMKVFFMNGHMNPAGYVLTARMMEAYIDHIIMSNPEDFHKAGLIGTPYCG